jgi:hypothetical protein
MRKTEGRPRYEGMPVQALPVVDVSDPALVVLQAENGARLKVGRMAVVQADTIHSMRMRET